MDFEAVPPPRVEESPAMKGLLLFLATVGLLGSYVTWGFMQEMVRFCVWCFLSPFAFLILLRWTTKNRRPVTRRGMPCILGADRCNFLAMVGGVIVVHVDSVLPWSDLSTQPGEG